MGPRSKREYVEAVFVRYKKASRKEKKGILDEFCAILDYHRKHAIRALRNFRRFTKPQKKKTGRCPLYDADGIVIPLSLRLVEASLSSVFPFRFHPLSEGAL